MSCIVNYWPTWFRDLYGGTWPDNYVTFDTETTGFDLAKDVVWEIAHCLVQDCKPVDRLSVIIDWGDHPIVPDHWLRNRLQYLRKSMELNGCKCHITYERMRDEGIKPKKALEFYYDIFKTFQAKDMLFVGRGSYAFDERALEQAFVGFQVAPEFRFSDNSMIDTDGIEKASQLLENKKAHPQIGDTLRSYFHRVKYIRATGIKSNLDTHCFNKYDLGNRGVDKRLLHRGDTDCFAEHVMMEVYRPMISGEMLVPPAPRQTQPTLQPLKRTKPAPQPTSTKRRRGQRNN